MKTAAGGSAPQQAPETLQQFLTYRLVRAVNRLNRQGAAVALGVSGLSLPEWRCLLIVASHGTLHVRDLLELMHETKGLVSRALSGLEDKGLVTLRRDSDDKRQIVATSTAKGMKVHQAALPPMQDRHRQLLRGISAADLAAVDRVIVALHGNLDQWEREMREGDAT